ncbi:PBSX family phage terminase large subunit [Paenibacillus polymyxa]|uniref:PBSX family phage terminase large subunit n=1 Tax=Paenibacillus polymyxa TaxID=1406 RepID=UPI000737C84A|nr:PBSX family phage terminase large subunit [Paenibacillus polymyxa]
MTAVTVSFNPNFKEMNFTQKRYRVFKGSAGSGKSVNVAQDFVIKLSDSRYKGANLLCIRKVNDTNRNSTYAELQAAINRIYGDQVDDYWDMPQSRLSIKHKSTGNEVIFRGVNDARDREKLKSINFAHGKLTWIWVEEATELQESDIDILDDRLRGILDNPNLYYQMTFTFNPVSATHWIKGKYFDTEHEDIITNHSTYLMNRFIDDAYHRRMMLRKERDPDGYKIYGLGEWGELGGTILSNYTVHDFDTSFAMFDSMTFGQDFGFNHANAILTVGFKDGEIFICNEIYVHEKDTGEIIALADGKLDKRIPMYCDSAEPDRIKTWRNAGYKASAVVKEPGSVNAQIDWLKKHKIHIHPSCSNTIKEMQQWKWKHDPKTNTYTDEPINFFDDAMAALRYAVEGMRKGPTFEF